MTTPETEGVHRLVDMTVEEVSLVDRAANRQRFLLVKKDDAMTTANAEKALDEETTTAGDPDEAFEDEAEEAETDSPLDIALSALESLTSMVDLLSTMGADESDPRLASLAEEMRRAAEAMLGGAGADTDTPADEEVQARDAGAEKSATSSEGTEAADPAAAGDNAAARTFAANVAAAKTALARLSDRASRTAKAKKPATPPVETGSTSAPTNPAADVLEQLSKVADAVKTLTSSVQEQSARLGKVEKQFGLPNSSTAEPVAKAAGEATTGWPLDMNRPMDRASVDKSISFHDV